VVRVAVTIPCWDLRYRGRKIAAGRIYPHHRIDAGGEGILFYLLYILWIKLMLGTEKGNTAEQERPS
jgi:hypothetical protein